MRRGVLVGLFGIFLVMTGCQGVQEGSRQGLLNDFENVSIQLENGSDIGAKYLINSEAQFNSLFTNTSTLPQQVNFSEHSLVYFSYESCGNTFHEEEVEVLPSGEEIVITLEVLNPAPMCVNMQDKLLLFPKVPDSYNVSIRYA